jgi:pyruvate dehydrogenase E2 component (dihydrolipoamide acetyltransferase)
MPVLGETMNEGTVVEWLKQEGQPVRRGEVLFTVESDKATLEVEAPADGFLRQVLVPAGTTVPVLTVVGLITRTSDEPLEEAANRQISKSANRQIGKSANQQAPSAPLLPGSPAPSPPLSPAPSPRLFASPRARKLAREKGVDLARVSGSGPDGRIVERDVAAYLAALPAVTPVARRMAEQAGLDLRTVQGSGPGGRITKEDVERALAAAPAPVVPAPPAAPVPPTPLPPLAPAPPTPAAAAETIAEVPLSGVRAVIARRMAASHQTTAPVTLTTEADATEFVMVRERLKASLADELGFNLGYNDLLIKLAARALKEFPYMNARLEGSPEEGAGAVIRHLAQVNVALAVDTERGLLVPVVREADRKGLVEIARELRGLVERARAAHALPDELAGSTFTITNLGVYEVDAFTPIINLPETAILGVGRIKARPAVVDGELCVRQTMWLSLTFDHRLVDGAPAARFLQRIKQLVEEPYLMLA